RVEGPLAEILTAERTLLNFLTHLSGIATATRAWVDAIDGTGAFVRDTRKTIPGLRVLEKYAVRCGGGVNHRMGLGDAALIKDNHIAAAGGVTAAFHAVLAAAPGVVTEVECDTLDQVGQALAAGAALILLDNMSLDQMRSAVAMARAYPAAKLEASGGLRLENAKEVASTGVHYLSVGALTHSSPALDLALDVGLSAYRGRPQRPRSAAQTRVPARVGHGCEGDASAATVDAVGERSPVTIDQVHPSLHVRSTVMTVTSPVVLEPAAQQVADAFSKPPFLYDMTPADARKVLQDAQSGPVSKLPVDEEWITVPAQVGEARVRLIKPRGATGMLPVIVYMHGGGWILGNAASSSSCELRCPYCRVKVSRSISPRASRARPITGPRLARGTSSVCWPENRRDASASPTSLASLRGLVTNVVPACDVAAASMSQASTTSGRTCSCHSRGRIPASVTCAISARSWSQRPGALATNPGSRLASELTLRSIATVAGTILRVACQRGSR